MDNRTDYIIRNLIYESFSQTSAYHLQYNRTYHNMPDLLPVNIIHIIKSFDVTKNECIFVGKRLPYSK